MSHVLHHVVGNMECQSYVSLTFSHYVVHGLRHPDDKDWERKKLKKKEKETEHWKSTATKRVLYAPHNF